jgi:pentatricopeptide repeat protein
LKSNKDLQPDRTIYTATMDACAKSGQWQEALILLEEYKKKQSLSDSDSESCDSEPYPDIRMYTACIDACGKGGKWEKSMELLEEAKCTTKLRLNPIIWLLLVKL